MEKYDIECCQQVEIIQKLVNYQKIEVYINIIGRPTVPGLPKDQLILKLTRNNCISTS